MKKTIATALALMLSVHTTAMSAIDTEQNDKIILPDMGDSSGTLITPEEEKEFGEAFFRSLHSQIDINQDAEIQEYIQTLGRKLAANSDKPDQPFHFFVVMENDINAFAGPGGYIGVNCGLILNTEAESELASVIAHEIGHVTQRHLYRAAEAASRLSIPTMAATLAAILLGMQSASMGQAAIMAIQAGSVQFQINFTRENEEEADRVGMQTLANSHFDPRSMPTFFEKLQQYTRYSGQDVPEFLRTHPVTASRISDTRGRAETYPYKQYLDSMSYQLTKAKIRVLTNAIDDKQTLTYFQTRLNQGTPDQREVAKYGMGLILLKMQKYSEAERILQELAQKSPQQPQYATALARIALESKDFETALIRYKKLAESYPENDAIALETINCLLKVRKPELAKQSLAKLSEHTQKLPVYWQLLAQTYSDLKQPAESHRYLAEYYYAIGQTQDAILQIKLAQKSKGLTFITSSILNERLHYFQTQQIEARLNHR